MHATNRRAAAALAALLMALPAGAQAGQPPVAAAAQVQLPAPMGVMQGRITIRGQAIAYRGEVGEIVLRNAAGAPRATMSGVAYLAEGGNAQRPVTFFYNGGPGAATIALREGLAPKVIAPGEQRGTFTFVDNGESLLDVSDLVFVDAPGTGYGRFYGEDAKPEYLGVEEDARAFADFIETWLKDHGRTSSPLFIMGESYGGVRSGFLAENLEKRGLPVNGVMLVSPSTSAGGALPGTRPDPAATALPTQAAVAWSHKKGAFANLPLEQLAAQAEKFALGDYAAALAKGDALPAAQRAKIAKRVADFTGLPADAIAANKLKVQAFGDSLLPGQRLGRDDGRLRAPIEEMKKLPPPYDEPGSSLYNLTYDAAAAFDSFFRFQFGYKPVGPYVRLALGRTWNNRVVRGPTSIPAMFKQQMTTNPKLRVDMIAGFFDTTIPYVRPMADFEAAGLPKDRYSHAIYPAGHAVFYDDVARKAAGDRMRAFIRR